MANQVRAQQLFHYRSFHINKSQPLGHGSYGAVYKAKCDQLPCAAKVLHPTILDPNDPGAAKIMQRFQQECEFLENIRHPNIVQYLGMTRDPESRLPVLLMELIDETLTKMLEHSQQSLAYCVQVNISHDITLAVAYLHSNDIIHRDLSSNNVLIMAKSRAKVTDFGMSKLVDAAPSMTPLTTCPGTQAYMPPEALDEPPVYTKKLDCFSEGVIMIQVCTRLWPEPRPRTKTIPFPDSPTGTTKVPVLEPERRKNHIDMIDRGHGLLPIAIDCLHYQENERPSSEELCQRLAGLKETREYRESKEQVERVQNDVAELEGQMGEIQVREAAPVLAENQQLHQQYQNEIKFKNGRIQELNQQQITTEIPQSNNSLRRQVEQLEQQLNQQTQQFTKPSQPSPPVPHEAQVGEKQFQQDYSVEEKQSQPSPQQVHHQGPHPPTRKIRLEEWRDGGTAPYKMARGAAVVDGSVAYFMDWDCCTWMYESVARRWSKLPDCSRGNSCLAVINGFLTVIGGQKRLRPDNKLLSIVNDRNNKWVEHFQPMPTKRQDASALTAKQYLIVAGGNSESNKRLATVEVMDIQAQVDMIQAQTDNSQAQVDDSQIRVWSTAASLPHSYSNASVAICGDQLYMLGGFDKDGARTKSVLTCSLTKLLQSCSETSSHLVWCGIADVPVYSTTCAAVNGELVAVGGLDAKNKSVSDIYKYNPTTNSWDIISFMRTARFNCLVAVLPSNEMMVVGGYLDLSWQRTNKVELVSIECT